MTSSTNTCSSSFTRFADNQAKTITISSIVESIINYKKFGRRNPRSEPRTPRYLKIARVIVIDIRPSLFSLQRELIEASRHRDKQSQKEN